MVICRKIFVFVILFFTLLCAKSYSEVVNKVEVQGNERISKETIAIFDSEIGLVIAAIFSGLQLRHG